MAESDEIVGAGTIFGPPSGAEQISRYCATDR